jgi:ParB/Sulfiredoxin domain
MEDRDMPKRKLEFEDERRWPVQNIPLKEIHRDSKVQPRERIDPSVVADYQERLQEGDVFPPVVVYCIDKKYLLVSGYHRLEAATLAGEKIIRCEVREGTLRDAILHSAACNSTHGLRRTWADKRKAVGTLLGDAEWARWSNNEIARRCHVSEPFVSSLRGQLVTSNVASEHRTYRTKHGTEGTMNITAIGRRSPAPSVSLLTATDDERQAEMVRISEVLEGKRGEFIAALAQIEKALLAQSGQLLRSNPSADVA